MSKTTPLPVNQFSETEKDHGRITQRNIKIYPISPFEANLSHAQTLIVIQRCVEEKGKDSDDTSFYISSHPITRGVKYFATLIRGHWNGCEIQNHWNRDANLGEDKTRIRDFNINCNLSSLRICALAIKSRFFPGLSWPDVFDTCLASPAKSYQAISNNRSK